MPGHKRYAGHFQFPKHFYPVLSDLEDGSEEWLCALAIEWHPRERRWVKCSGGRALFVMVYKREQGLNLSQQLDAALA